MVSGRGEGTGAAGRAMAPVDLEQAIMERPWEDGALSAPGSRLHHDSDRPPAPREEGSDPPAVPVAGLAAILGWLMASPILAHAALVGAIFASRH